MNLLRHKFDDAVKAKKKTLARHTEELLNLERLAKRSSSLELKWEYVVNSKNAFKTIQVAQVLVAFKKRKGHKAYQNLEDIRMPTSQLWIYTQLGSVAGTTPATSKFRSYLNWLKTQGLLNYDKNTKKWKLTEEAIKKLE